VVGIGHWASNVIENEPVVARGQGAGVKEKKREGKRRWVRKGEAEEKDRGCEKRGCGVYVLR
jgi:hypothetical protein